MGRSAAGMCQTVAPINTAVVTPFARYSGTSSLVACEKNDRIISMDNTSRLLSKPEASPRQRLEYSFFTTENAYSTGLRSGE